MHLFNKLFHKPVILHSPPRFYAARNIDAERAVFTYDTGDIAVCEPARYDELFTDVVEPWRQVVERAASPAGVIQEECATGCGRSGEAGIDQTVKAAILIDLHIIEVIVAVRHLVKADADGDG